MVTIELDMKKSVLRFLVNDEDKGLQHNNIDRGDDIKYQLAVTLRGTGSKVTLQILFGNDHNIFFIEILQ